MLNLDRLTPKNDLIQRSKQLEADAKELLEQVRFLQAYAQRLEEMIHTGKEPL
jgi:predicted nuclease with TOPRIM domain